MPQAVPSEEADASLAECRIKPVLVALQRLPLHTNKNSALPTGTGEQLLKCRQRDRVQRNVPRVPVFALRYGDQLASEIGSSGLKAQRLDPHAIEKVLPMCCPRRLTLHYYAQNAVDARLVAFAMTLKPSEHVLIQANRQLLFRGGPGHRRLLEKGLVEPRNVRIVNIAILHTVNPCQVALDRFSVHVDFPFSWR
jgi:hypothetical protein